MSYRVHVPKAAREIEVGGRVYKTRDGTADVPPVIGRMIQHVADVTNRGYGLSHTDIVAVNCLDCGHQSLFGPECKWCKSENTVRV